MKLFESGKIGQLTLKNRIVMAPMNIGGLVEPDCTLSQQGIDYFAARARGGAGLIISCATRVSDSIEGYIRRLRVDGSTDTAWIKKLANAVHEHGSKIALQLTPGYGHNVGPRTINKGLSVGPSGVPTFFDPNIMTRKLTAVEIERVAKAFGLAARIARDAGIDAVELHGHSGYLFDEFMTTFWNKRTDKYGGSLDGRLRFVLEAIQAVRREAGTDFPIIFRYALTHYIEGGRGVDEGLEIARRLAAAGVDAFDIDAGSYENRYWPHPPTTMPLGCMVNLAEMTKRVVKVPVMAVGKLGRPDLAESVLREGKADFIILGRALLADPDWPNKVREGRPEDICPCIGDHGCIKLISTETNPIGCTVNPLTGAEKELEIKPAKKRKSVLVVGGGPGGMEAARVAALRGHRVTLWDTGNALGGSLIPAAVPGFKQEYGYLVDYLSTQIRKLGVAVELGKEATPELIYAAKPDVVFVATGSAPVIPRIPGVKKDRVVTATDLLLGKKEAGKSVVVIGGGLVGSETALYLAQQGKRVTIVECLDGIARDMYLSNRAHLLKLLVDCDVTILIETKALEITDAGVDLADRFGGKSTLKADTVVLATGLKANKKLYRAIKDRLPEVYAIGDCVEARRVIDAIWEGFNTARSV